MVCDWIYVAQSVSKLLYKLQVYCQCNNAQSGKNCVIIKQNNRKLK